MASKDKAKNTPGVSKGGKKSSRWSPQTRANKERAAETRARRLQRAAERRSQGATVTDPVTGKVKKSVVTRDRRALQAARIKAKRISRYRKRGDEFAIVNDSLRA